MSLKLYIQEYMKYDSQITNYNTVLKTIKKNKSTVEETIIRHITANNLENSKFELNNNIIELKKKEVSGGLSMKLLKEVLTEELANDKYVTFLIDKINQKKQTEKKSLMAWILNSRKINFLKKSLAKITITF